MPTEKLKPRVSAPAGSLSFEADHQFIGVLGRPKARNVLAELAGAIRAGLERRNPIAARALLDILAGISAAKGEELQRLSLDYGTANADRAAFEACKKSFAGLAAAQRYLTVGLPEDPRVEAEREAEERVHAQDPEVEP